MHLRLLLATLMAVLALSPSGPLFACAGLSNGECKIATCCCGDGACTKDMPCEPSCKVVQAQELDKQSPAPAAHAPSVRLLAFLTAYMATPKNLSASSTAFRHRELNASPPFGGSPPQAVLRVWLV